MVNRHLIAVAGLSAAMMILGGCDAPQNLSGNRPFMGATTSPARMAKVEPISQSSAHVTIQMMPQLASTASPGFKFQTITFLRQDDAAFAAIDFMPSLGSTAFAGTQWGRFRLDFASDLGIVKTPDLEGSKGE